MDQIDLELKSRHELAGAFLTLDPSEIIDANPPSKARWIVWSYGAAGLLSGDKDLAGKWLQACLKLSKEEEHRTDRLWMAETFSALSELSLVDGEYFDAIGRSGNACAMWKSIESELSAKEQAESPSSLYEGGTKEYVNGDVSDGMQQADGSLRAGPETTEIVLQRTVVKFLDTAQIALQANAQAARYDPELEAIVQEFLTAQAGQIPKEVRYTIFIALGNLSVSTGAIEESIRWFDNAIGIYYQACRDYQDLYRLVQSMFNKANSLARLGRYDEALNIYHMIAGDFEKVGDYEAELRIDYAILHTRYNKGERDGLEDELRNLVYSYHKLIEEMQMYHRQLDVQNLGVVNSLLLDFIASKPNSAESFLEGIMISTRSDSEPSGEIVKRFHAMQEGRFTDWRAVGAVELLDAFLAPEPDSMMLTLDSGAETLVVFALRGGNGSLSERCYIAPMCSEFVDAFKQLLIVTSEENERIIERRKGERDSATEQLRKYGNAVWNHFPGEIRQMISACNRLFVVLSPFGSIDEFPVELVLTDDGWLGLTHAICRANSVPELVASLSRNRTPRQVSDTALVLRAGDPSGMATLDHALQEAQDVVQYARLLGLDVRDPVTLGPEEVIEELRAGHHLFHYVGHGSATVLGERLLLSEDRWLPSVWLRQMVSHRAPVTFLSACEMGRSRLAGGGDKGFVVEMLRSGAPGVMAVTRPIADRISGDMVREVYAASADGAALPEALQNARRKLDAEGFNPVCWSAYTFYGRPEAALKPGKKEEFAFSWHQHLMRFLASGADVHREAALQALKDCAANNETLTAIANWLESDEKCWGEDTDALVANLASHDLLGALRLRAYISAYRVEQELAQKGQHKDYLVEEIGTGLTIALSIHDSFAFVGVARRHYPLMGIVLIDEVMQVLRYAVSLADAMVTQDAKFMPVLKELADELNQLEGKMIIDLSKVLPQHMLD